MVELLNNNLFQVGRKENFLKANYYVVRLIQKDFLFCSSVQDRDQFNAEMLSFHSKSS